MVGGHEDEGGVPFKPTVLTGASIGSAKKQEVSIPPAEKGEVGSQGVGNTLRLAPRGHAASPS